MSKSHLSTPAKLLARYLRQKGLAALTHTQALEALAHAGNVDFRVVKAKESEVLGTGGRALAESLRQATEIVELLFQTLSDWKPDQREAYGLGALFEKAERFTRPLEKEGISTLVRKEIVDTLVEDVKERARKNAFRIESPGNALDLVLESAGLLRLDARTEELLAAAEQLC